MNTKGEIADRIITDFRQNYPDRPMSRRYVMSIFLSSLGLLLERKLSDRKTSNREDLYSYVDCYDFEEINVKRCPIIEFRTCESIMKGKKKLPELLYSKYGSSIRSISSLDLSVSLDKTTPKKYKNDSKRRGYKSKPLYYVKEGYPYLLNTKMKAGVIELITTDQELTEQLDCNSTKKDRCKSSLEYEIKADKEMIEAAIKMTQQEIMETYMKIRPDEDPDNNENNI